jgi:3-oxoacyl-[acyl-carrier-protein] synthase-3
MSHHAYINSFGKFLPNDPIPNDEMEEFLGLIHGKPSRLKTRILKQNGIKARHYALARNGETTHWNYQLAAEAIRDAMMRSEVVAKDIEFLGVATSQSDLLAPGFASLVHGELKFPSCEIASFQSICAGGIMALQAASQGIVAGKRGNSVVCASEFTSRFFRNSLVEEANNTTNGGGVSFDSEFLRWMLSDGAGAAVLENRPNTKGLSLRIEWIDLISYADKFDLCMYSGVNKMPDGSMERSWYDYPSFAAASNAGAILLKQDVRILDNIVKLGVKRYFELIDKGLFKSGEVDWLVCHYSSHVFRGMIIDLLEKGGGMIPEDRWFTNLYSKGNTGSASIFIMLEELFNGGNLKPGQKILCMVPESGRFIVSYMLLTVVGNELLPEITGSEAVKLIDVQSTGKQNLSEQLVRNLTSVWMDFEARLNQVPIIDKLNRSKWRLEDYRLLLLNLRQQVVEGGRWIARAASNIDYEAFDLRSAFIGHAQDEHRDFRLLEQDFISIGGTLEEIQNAEKNIGSEAFSAWMFHRAGRENPFDLLGAMFIIEGLGQRVANKWGEQIRKQLRLTPEQVSFLLYHGSNDEKHLEKFQNAIDSGILNEERVKAIVKCAKVTARLYLLQLEEVGNY